MHDATDNISWTDGVPRLHDFWSQIMQTRAGVTAPGMTTDAQLDMLLCDGLGLNFLETLQYLYGQASTFEEFANWIVARNGRPIAPEQIERVKAACEGHASLPAPHEYSPVLSPEEMNFWHQNGYVILHDAVTPGHCADVVQAICEFLDVRLDDPDTWYGNPDGHTIWVGLIHHPALEATRQSPRIRCAFEQVWGTTNLWTTIDRCGVNPPERPGWTFPGPHLHWDTSISLPIPLGVQGLLYLTDTEASQGAFTCIPGFHRRIEQWLASLPPGANPREQDFSRLGAIPIAGRAGDLILWHHALPHGSSPNRAARPRLVQYIKFYPPDQPDTRPWK